MPFKPRTERNQLLTLLALTVSVATLATMVMGWALYLQAIDQQSEWLESIARNEATLIQAMTHFENQQNSSLNNHKTITEIAEELGRSSQFGKTGTIVLARQADENITFLLSQNSTQNLIPGAAEPMRRAMAGETGVLIGPDYRNIQVLAAHVPLAELGLGLVAKIDLAEIRTPLIRQTILGGAGALLIILLGSIIALRISRPLIRRLEMAVDSLNEAQQIANMGSWQWNIEDGSETWSDQQFRIFGYQPNQITPSYESFLKALHPDDLVAVETAINNALKQHAPFNMHFRIVLPSGQLRYIDAQGRVHYNQLDQPTSMTGTILDNTNYKLLESFLADAKERAEEFLSISQAMIIALDAAGIVTMINRRGAEILDTTQQDIIGCNWFETMVHEGVRDELYTRHRAIFAGSADVNEYEEYSIVSRAGKQCHLSWHNTIKRNLQGTAISCLNSGIDVTKLKQAEQASRHLASHDVLTGLPNRVLFNDRLQQAIVQAQRNHSKVGLLYLDLNDFKPVNDTLGHAIGDAVLKVVGIRLQSALRQEDTVARLGGDEFTVIMINLSDQNVVSNMMDKIADALTRPIQIDQHQIHISASIGSAIYPIDASDAGQLLSKADSAMYAEKYRQHSKPRSSS